MKILTQTVEEDTNLNLVHTVDCVGLLQDSSEPTPEPKDVPVLVQLRLMDQRDSTAKVGHTIQKHVYSQCYGF